MKNGDIVELIENTDFYKKGRKAIIINILEGEKDFEIRYHGEDYEGDVDVMPKSLFKLTN